MRCRTTSDQRPATVIDTHAHLTFPQFDKDREEVAKRAWDAGLSQMILVGAGDGLEGNARAIQFAKSDERFFAIVGVHPHDAAKVKDGWLSQIKTFASEKKVVAVGEIGLDYYYNDPLRDVQQDRFREQLKLAEELGLPVVVHDREAHEDVWRLICEAGIPKQGGVFHCFSGGVAFAEKVIEAGFLISIPGIVTYKNAALLREIVSQIPLEKMVIETDCPYLSPEPHRGRRNEPSFVVEVAKKIAEIKGLFFEDVARITTLNTKRIFGLPGAELEGRIAYEIRDSLYLNITNRCNLACRFCPKFSDYEVKGHYLKLSHEPSVEEIFQAIGLPDKYVEVVFCGYGEPTLRIEIVKVIAARMKEKGVKRVRLNTDGLACLVYGRNVLPELKGLIDAVSVSLNAPDAESYVKNCPSKFGETGYTAVCDFILEAKKYIPEVAASVVALPGFDVEACRKRADDLGVPLRIREYMNVG